MEGSGEKKVANKQEHWDMVSIAPGSKVELSSIELHPELQEAAKGFAGLVSSIEAKETGGVLRTEEVFGRLMDSAGTVDEEGGIRFSLTEDGEELGSFNIPAGYWRYTQ